MSAASWKSYGGIYKTNNINNLGVGTIVTDRILVRKQNTTVLTFNDSITVQGYQDVTGNVLSTQNTVSIGSVFAGNSVFVDNRILFVDNIVNKKVEGDPGFTTPNAPISNLTDTYQSATNYIGGNLTTVGIGTNAPRHFFEVYENSDTVNGNTNVDTTMFSVRSERNKTNSILVSNNDGTGVKTKANGNVSSLEFHASDLDTTGNLIATLQNSGSDFKIQNDVGSIYIDALTLYLQSDGTTKIDVSNNVTISSQLSVSNSAVSNSFLSEYYTDASSNYQTTDGIVLTASDASANIFQHFVNTSNKGLSIGGGGFIENKNVSTGTIGLLSENNSSSDSSFIPTMTICEGTSKIANRTTLGVNTYSPNTSNYTMDINGKTRIGHSEIHIREKPDFVINNIDFSKTTPLYGMVAGGVNAESLFSVYVTEDGGENWTMKSISNPTLTSNENSHLNKLTIHVHGSTYAYIVAERSGVDDIILYSTDKGTNWVTILSALSLNYNKIFGYFDVSHNIFTASPTSDDSKLYYYTVGNNTNTFALDISYNTSHFIEDFAGTESNIIYSTGQDTNTSECVIGKYVFDASNGGTTTYEYSFSGPSKFNRIVAYDDNHVVAVGNDYIAYTSTGGGETGSAWTLLSNTGFNLHDVHILSSQYGIAIGSGIIVYSTDSYKTWTQVPDTLLNASGMKNRLMNDLDANSKLSMSSHNVLISNTNNTSSSELFNNYLPTLFNTDMNVLDISGGVFVSGKITCDELSIKSFVLDSGGIAGQTIQF